MNLTGIKNEIVKLYKGTKPLEKISCFFNRKKGSKRTDKFRVIQSYRVVEVLREKLQKLENPIDFTFTIPGANGSRTESERATKKHLVKIYPEFPSCYVDGVGRFTIMFYNAADGLSRFVGASGFDVNACSNGMVWNEIASYATKHIYIDPEQVIQKFTDDIVAFLVKMQNGECEEREMIAKMSRTRLDNKEIEAFAKEALLLKIAENQNNFVPDANGEKTIELLKYDSESLLQRLHDEHKSNTVWNVFQTVQENLRGNLRSENIKRDLPSISYTLNVIDKETGKKVEKTKYFRSDVTDVAKFQKFNLELTKMASELTLKKAA